MQTKAFTPTYPTNNDFISIITDLINTSPRFRIEGTYRTYGYEILVTEDFNTKEEMLEFMNEVHNKVSASYNFCTTEEVERHISLFWYDYHDVLQKLIGYLRSPQKRQKAFWTNDFRMMKLMKMRCEYLSGGLIKYFNDKTALQITEPKIQIHCQPDNPYTEGANTVPDRDWETNQEKVKKNLQKTVKKKSKGEWTNIVCWINPCVSVLVH